MKNNLKYVYSYFVDYLGKTEQFGRIIALHSTQDKLFSRVSYSPSTFRYFY